MTEKLLKTNKTFIIENNFNPKQHQQKIKLLLEKYGYESTEVFLEADPAIILKRHKQRWESGERHRGHADNERFLEFEIKLKEEEAVPLNVSKRVVRIDTSDFSKVNYDEELRNIN